MVLKKDIKYLKFKIENFYLKNIINNKNDKLIKEIK